MATIGLGGCQKSYLTRCKLWARAPEACSSGLRPRLVWNKWPIHPRTLTRAVNDSPQPLRGNDRLCQLACAKVQSRKGGFWSRGANADYAKAATRAVEG